MDKKNKGRWTLSFLREIFVVLSGVLIALLLNDWKETRDDSAYVDSVKTAISKDIKESKESVQGTLDRHYIIIDSLKSHMNDSIPIMDAVANAGGVQYPIIRNISLRFLDADKISLIDYAVVSQLSDIELLGEMLEKKFDKLMDFAYSTMYAGDYQSKYEFLINLSNVIDSEESLISAYKEVLKNKSFK